MTKLPVFVKGILRADDALRAVNHGAFARSLLSTQKHEGFQRYDRRQARPGFSEEAIRDRPGRINQCLYFGLPGPELRRRYLLQYLRPYDISAVDMEHVVRQTDQASQAFLKEYVLRAVQIAAEDTGFQPRSPHVLQTTHFDAAFDELTGHGDPHGHSIMGFRGERRPG